MINNFYLSDDVLQQIASSFKSNNNLPSVSLQSFFDEGSYQDLLKSIKKLSWKEKKKILCTFPTRWRRYLHPFKRN